MGKLKELEYGRKFTVWVTISLPLPSLLLRLSSCSNNELGVEWKVELSGRCEKFHQSYNGGVKSIQLTFVDLVPINVSGI